MDAFQNILVVRTGNPADAAALDRAIRLARRHQARMSVAGVVLEPPEEFRRLLAAWLLPEEEWTTAVAGTVSSEIELMVDTAREQGIDARGHVVRGSPSLEIIRKVLRDDHDLVVKAAEPTEEIKRILFGHTDRQLIRKCPCPVWIDKPGSTDGYNRILAAVDPEPVDEEAVPDPVREHLNTLIVKLAILLAETEQAEVEVVHAWPFDFADMLRTRSSIPPEALTRIAQSIRHRHERALRELVKPFESDVASVHLLKGPAAAIIPQLAARESIDLIVMGSLSRSGMSGLLIGNTAEAVIDQVDCSVLTLKPRGFVSPVALP